MPERQEESKMSEMALRKTDSNYFSGAHLRGKRRPLYVLVNMGEGRVAFGRDNDVINPAAAAQVRLRADLKTYPIEDVLSRNVLLERGLSKGPWQTAVVSEEDITEPFRGEGEPEGLSDQFYFIKPFSPDRFILNIKPPISFIDMEASQLPRNPIFLSDGSSCPDGKWGHRDLRLQPILPDILEPILPDILGGLFNLNKGPEWPTPQDFSAISALFKAMKFFGFIANRE